LKARAGEAGLYFASFTYTFDRESWNIGSRILLQTPAVLSVFI